MSIEHDPFFRRLGLAEERMHDLCKGRKGVDDLLQASIELENAAIALGRHIASQELEQALKRPH